MAKFRKKPVEIEAIQWLGLPMQNGAIHAAAHMQKVEDWLLERMPDDRSAKFKGDTIEIETLEGTMTASPKDWIICGVQGELYPCKPDIFEATYDPA